jgi:acyl-lipid omega-6 desaturase (Delta-12 desaturase)
MPMASDSTPAADTRNIYQTIASFARPSAGKAVWQLLCTMIPFFVLWALMIFTIQRGESYLITLALAIPAAGLHIRIFIFFHDCCHGSFFASRRANRIVGYITGVLTFTPFEQWRRSHVEHHATVGDLDRRGMGDIWTLTVEEYQSASPLKRLAYRVVRNPVAMLCFGPLFLFAFVYRFTPRDAKKGERFSVWFTNLALLALIVAAGLTMGWQTYLKIQIPILFLSGSFGVWLFYIQHQFEGVYWARHEAWDPLRAALEGSSYYQLPAVVQWFTGSIGLHHIHHAQPRIPNYNLQKCLDEVPTLKAMNRLTIGYALHALRLRLWDERAQKMVGFNR